MTPEQRAVLRSALGIDYSPAPDRNDFGVATTTSDAGVCRQCVMRGWMRAGRVDREIVPNDFEDEPDREDLVQFYHVTEAGAAALGVKLPT